MSQIEIRSGLRKLEFDATERALVEFARDVPLPDAKTVRIELGLRDGVLRELTGCPELIEAKDEKRGKREYVYRLRANIEKVARCESRPRKSGDAA
jgi:hypothetical protein